MILNETFVGNTQHYDFARRAQSESPFTHQNQVVELQKAAIGSQLRSQTVPESKSNMESGPQKKKEEKEELISYSRSGKVYANTAKRLGNFFDSSV
ncbi:hypothetical protein LPTSP4_20350 [Leptospira ryugenii]|uniref:Uncharacterized protein n=1 Tax=Leptospira ryugenii TaxID=1917863 RepID=A0A2P2E0V8_9LEPT|nr:hypothetical protein [Leptospira ryugenii]GBF50509.1 hypothetical protein LPTSP4_20350 [Leptospira ryugenii]